MAQWNWWDGKNTYLEANPTGYAVICRGCGFLQTESSHHLATDFQWEHEQAHKGKGHRSHVEMVKRAEQPEEE